MAIVAGTAADYQRHAAFRAFDLDGSGAIAQTDVRYAFQACEEIGTLVAERDVQTAMRRAGVRPGELVRFDQFSRMCEIVADFEAPRRNLADRATDLLVEGAVMEQQVCLQSPRRCTRSVPMARWDDHWHNNKAEDFPWLAGPAAEVHPDPLPQCPLSPKACLSDLEDMDEVGNAFYLFDTEFTGMVSGCELPNMLRLVPKGEVRNKVWVRKSDKKGHKTLARPEGSGPQKQKLQKKWDAILVKALDKIGKEYSDIINIHEFQLIVDDLDPPAEPHQPPEPGCHDEGYETTESEKQRRAEEEERLRREEEERQIWEKMMGGTVIVKLEDGSFLKLLHCRDTDQVSTLHKKLQEQTGRDPKDMRLIGRGFEMDPRREIADFGVKVGAPWHLVPPGGPFAWDDGDILTLLWRDAPPEEDDGVVSGWLQVQLLDGTRIQVFCEDDEPIEHIQRRMAEQVQMPPTVQRLVVHGREMNARKTLRDYKVALGPAGDVVDVLLREVPAEPQFYIEARSPRLKIR